MNIFAANNAKNAKCIKFGGYLYLKHFELGNKVYVRCTFHYQKLKNSRHSRYSRLIALCPVRLCN